MISGALLAGFVVFGLLIGTLFGFFGMGGSFLVTPALLVLGYPAEVAVGSGLAFVFGTAIIAAIKHHGMGQVDVKLGAGMFAGTAIGIELGKELVFYLKDLGLAENVISIAYVVLLGTVGALTLRDAAKDTAATAEGETHPLLAALQRLSVPPVIEVKGGAQVSLWSMLLVGFATGVLAGVLGVGGGFILMPALVYGLGVPVAVAVGTDLFQIVFSGGFGAFRYAQLGSVDLAIVVPLLAGSALGAILGAKATSIVDADEIKGTFGGMLIAGSVAVGIRQIGLTWKIDVLETVSLVLIFGSAVLVTGVIAWSVLKAIQKTPPEEPTPAPQT